MHYKILPALSATILLVAGLCATARAQRLPYFRPDIFRITPVIGMGEGLFMKKNATTYGVGMSYEHVFGRSQTVGVYLPFYFGVKSKTNSFNKNYSYLFNPGVKVYPMGQHIITYAVGASFLAVMGEDGYVRRDEGYFRAGVTVNNYCTMNFTPRFNLNFEFGIGPTFFNRYTDASAQSHRLNETIYSQASLHIGYRL